MDMKIAVKARPALLWLFAFGYNQDYCRDEQPYGKKGIDHIKQVNREPLVAEGFQ